MKKKANLIFTIFLCVTCLLGCYKLLDNNNSSNNNNIAETNKPTIENSEFDFSNTTLAFLGDSITYGYVTKQGGQYANPWPKLVGETLNAKESINYGIGGTNIAKVEGKTNSFVERYITMDNKIDIIGVMGGTNDWGNNVPLGTIDDTNETTIYGALNLIASGLKEKYPNSYIFFMSPIPRKETWANSQGYKMKDVRDAFLNVANKYDLGFLDMYYLSGFENEMKLDTTDGVHPSQELVKNSFAPTITQFIKENYKQNK